MYVQAIKMPPNASVYATYALSLNIWHGILYTDNNGTDSNADDNTNVDANNNNNNAAHLH